MPDLLVYSRHGCHLCEVLIEELLELVRGQANVRVLDVESRDDWRETYNKRIPVVELDGHFLCEYTLDRELVLTALSKLAEEG